MIKPADDQGAPVEGRRFRLPADALPRTWRDRRRGKEHPGGVVLEALLALPELDGEELESYKNITKHGAGNVAVVLQGVLRPPAAQGGTFVLEGAGFQVNIKTPRPTGQAPQ